MGVEFKPILKSTGQISKSSLEEGRSELIESGLQNTPIIPGDVIANLPDILHKGCKVFLSERERDTFLTGSISVLSSCFPTLTGLYDCVYVGPNLYTFIIAPCAHGKGSLTWSQALGSEYHKSLLKQNEINQQKYMEELKQYEKKKENGDTDGSKPEPPQFLQLFIPADNSAAGLIAAIHQNKGRGLICETEADTLSNTLSQDWGNFSHLLRKAFHHERIAYQRKTGKEFIEIERSFLSIALSGTPGQVCKLIPSAEDGLFSRFIYYAFMVEPDWRDVSPHSGRPNLTNYFETLATDVNTMVSLYESNGEVLFELHPYQWEKLNQTFNHWLNLISILVGENAISVVKRLGLITFRMAMIFSALRAYQKSQIFKTIICKDDDFEMALILAGIYKDHAITMFGNLPKTPESHLPSMIKTFYQELPDHFKREQIEVIAKKYEIADRTISKYLKKIEECNLIENYKHGYYRKKHQNK